MKYRDIDINIYLSKYVSKWVQNIHIYVAIHVNSSTLVMTILFSLLVRFDPH